MPVKFPNLHFLVNVIDMPAVCATTGVHDPDRRRRPWRFHSCRSWTRLLTCPLLCSVRCHGPDCAEARGDITVAERGQGFDMPVVVQRQVAMVLTVQQNHVETPKLPTVLIDLTTVRTSR